MEKNKILIPVAFVSILLLMGIGWYGIYQYFFVEDNSVASTIAEVKQKVTNSEPKENTFVTVTPGKLEQRNGDSETFGFESQEDINNYYKNYQETKNSKANEQKVAEPAVAGISTSKDLKVYVQEQYADKKLAINSYSFSNENELNSILNNIKKGDIVYLKLNGKVYEVTTDNIQEIKSLIK